MTSTLLQKIKFSISFLLFGLVANSQNLVLNPDFEIYLCERWYNSSLENCEHWSSPTLQSPDYFINVCQGYISSRFPDELWWGPQLPASGKAYAGIIAYRPNEDEPEKIICEYLQGTLSRSLKANTFYKLELFISLSESSSLSLQDLGIYFSEKRIETKKLQVLKLKPQVNLPLINDTSRWIKLTQTFATSGNENYFSIGCFDPKATARTKKVKPSPKIKQPRKEAYYFIDNISICPVEEDEEELRIPKSPVKLYVEMLRTPTAFDTIIHEGSNVVLQNIAFESGKAQLLASSFAELYDLVLYLNKNSDYHIQINGYTDNRGNEKSNLLLSEERAKAVAMYLEERGVDPTRILYKGFGSADPIEDNNTQGGRATNRRVTFTLLKK